MQNSFADVQFAECLSQLDKLGNPLPKLDEVVPWESFRPHFKGLYKQELHGGRKGGRPPLDCVMMLKVLVLQDMYKLSDDQAEYQIRDRLSFKDFLGLGAADRVPDAKTIWLFRERVKEGGLMEALFAAFLSHMDAAGFVARKGQIVDASIIEAPRQRNRREENDSIKEGEAPDGWGEAKARQKDRDARWVTKRGRSHYGYKNHIGVDNGHKLIRRYGVTAASTHDSRQFGALLDPDNSSADVWADSAYRSEQIEALLAASGYRSRIHRKGRRGKPLSKRSRQANRNRSRTRVRVEHVFARQGKRLVRTIGLARAQVKIGMQNLVYNMNRLAWLTG